MPPREVGLSSTPTFTEPPMRASALIIHPLPTAPIAALLACLAATPATAQLVTPRTVPVMQDEQFDIYPSRRPGLAGISIAIDDTLSDPFTNPAKATRLRGFTISTAPYSHSISGNRGGGRTLPIGFFALTKPFISKSLINVISGRIS